MSLSGLVTKSLKAIHQSGNNGLMSQHPLKKFRAKQDPPWTQGRLAEALGVKRVTVCRWETGERFPERDLWPRIRAVTGLGVDDLHSGRAA